MSKTAKQWDGPKSRCFCGHTGDGDNSQHEAETRHGLLLEGKGCCAAPGCDCENFTWSRWLVEFEQHLKAEGTPNHAR